MHIERTDKNWLTKRALPFQTFLRLTFDREKRLTHLRGIKRCIIVVVIQPMCTVHIDTITLTF